MNPGHRARVLRELGLTPRWRLRASPSAAEAASSDALVPARRETRRIERSLHSGQGSAELAMEREERRRVIGALEWSELQAAVSGCTACTLCKSRRNTVFGVGHERARVLVVGEAPGQEEDARGEPFVGQAGRLLDNMLEAVGMTRARDVYIANVLKCRPPGNRNPEPVEVDRCSPYLARQIELVSPRLIIAMGRFAAQTLLATDASIASLRGRVLQHQGVPVVVTYHPAYLLRSLQDKAKAWEDLLFVRRELARLG